MYKDILKIDNHTRRGYQVLRDDHTAFLSFRISDNGLTCSPEDCWSCINDESAGINLASVHFFDGYEIKYIWVYDARTGKISSRGNVLTRSQAIAEALTFLNAADFDLDTLPHSNNELPGWTLHFLEGFLDNAGNPCITDYCYKTRFRNSDEFEIAKSAGELWIGNGDDESDETDICINGVPYQRVIISDSFKESISLNKKIERQPEKQAGLLF